MHCFLVLVTVFHIVRFTKIMHDQWQPRGIVNFRDVGGAVGSKAGPKPGQLFRSSGLGKQLKVIVLV